MWARREDSTEKKGRPVLLGNKDGWMIGSNPSLRSFHIAPCSMPWHVFLTSLLFIYFFGNIQNGKKMQKKKSEMVGVRKKCQGIFFFPLFSGYLLIQHLRKSGGQPRFWGSLPR